MSTPYKILAQQAGEMRNALIEEGYTRDEAVKISGEFLKEAMHQGIARAMGARKDAAVTASSLESIAEKLKRQ